MLFSWIAFSGESGYQLFSLIHDPLEYLSPNSNKWIRTTAHIDQRGRRLPVTRRNTLFIKRIPLVEDVGMLITYGIVLHGFLCALKVERMDILRGCAKHRKLTAKVTFTPLKSQRRRITQARQRKENRKRKFNVTEKGSGFSTKNVYSLRNFPFLELKTLNSV